MANRYWVGGTATWDGTAGSKWATTSGGAGGSAVPTAADDVFLDGASGAVTVTTSSTSVCRSITCTGYVGTLTLSNNATSLSVGDGSGGALLFVAGMTLTIAGSSTVIRMVSTSNNGGTGWGVTTGGKSVPAFVFNGSGGKWVFQDSFTQSTASVNHTVTISNGTLDTNGQTCSWGGFALGAGTKTLTLGASTITLQSTSGTNTWNANTNVANFTLNANTSSIIQRSSTAAPTFAGGGLTYYNASVTQSSGGWTIQQSNTFNNLTHDNTVLGGGNRALSLQTATTTTINGTFTHTANSATNRGNMVSSSQGTTATVALGASGTASVTDVDFEDIAFTGTNTPVTAAGGSRLADCGGNSGITFASPVTYYWIGNGGNMSSATKYSTSSGGSAGSVTPLVHDNLIIDANSITSAGQTIVGDVMRIPGLDFTNVLNNPTFNPRNPSGNGIRVFGHFKLKSGMGYSLASAAGGSNAFSLRGRASYTLNQAGVDITSNTSITIAAPGGTYTLANDLTTSNSSGFGISAGVFDADVYNVTATLISSSNSNTRTIDMGSGIWTLTGTGTVWQLSTMTGLTFDSGTSKLVFSDTSATSKTFAHGSALTMYNLEITGGGSGAIIFGANSTSWNNFTVLNAPTTIQFTAGAGSATTIRNNWNVVGTAGNLITINSTTAAAHTLNKTSGIVSSDYLSLTNSTAQGGAGFYAGLNSTNGGGNTGWIFTAPPSGRMLLLGVG